MVSSKSTTVVEVTGRTGDTVTAVGPAYVSAVVAGGADEDESFKIADDCCAKAGLSDNTQSKDAALRTVSESARKLRRLRVWSTFDAFFTDDWQRLPLKSSNTIA